MTLYPHIPILLIDDEPEILKLLESFLISGHISHLILCTDGFQALSVLNRQEICLILMDLTMPHIHGETLLETVSENYPNIPVIIITGAVDAETAVRCMKSKAMIT